MAIRHTPGKYQNSLRHTTRGSKPSPCLRRSIPAPEEPSPPPEKPIQRNDRTPPARPRQGAQQLPGCNRQTTGIPGRPTKNSRPAKARTSSPNSPHPANKGTRPTQHANLYPAPANGTRQTAERTYAHDEQKVTGMRGELARTAPPARCYTRGAGWWVG
jgi:hypothetical protein